MYFICDTKNTLNKLSLLSANNINIYYFYHNFYIILIFIFLYYYHNFYQIKIYIYINLRLLTMFSNRYYTVIPLTNAY